MVGVVVAYMGRAVCIIYRYVCSMGVMDVCNVTTLYSVSRATMHDIHTLLSETLLPQRRLDERRIRDGYALFCLFDVGAVYTSRFDQE